MRENEIIIINSPYKRRGEEGGKCWKKIIINYDKITIRKVQYRR